jgi:peptide/nickel transport system permease protein
VPLAGLRTVESVPDGDAESSVPVSQASTVRADAWKRFWRNRLAVVGLLIVAGLLFAALLAPVLAPHDPGLQDLAAKRTAPGARFLLGADEFGRDILSRIIYGTRVALLVGTVSVGIALLLGLSFGILSGYAGGVVDSLVSRGMEILLAFPYLLLAIAVVSALGPGVLNTTLAVGIWAMPAFTRIVRASVISLREMDYIQAARAMGVPTRAIILRHLIPNFLPTLIVYSTLYMANAILVEAALSFLGLGVQPPTASWGLMVATGRDFLLMAPHITTIPGLAIMLAVLGFNLLGDGLRDALDPRLRT